MATSTGKAPIQDPPVTDLRQLLAEILLYINTHPEPNTIVMNSTHRYYLVTPSGSSSENGDDTALNTIKTAWAARQQAGFDDPFPNEPEEMFYVRRHQTCPNHLATGKTCEQCNLHPKVRLRDIVNKCSAHPVFIIMPPKQDNREEAETTASDLLKGDRLDAFHQWLNGLRTSAPHFLHPTDPSFLLVDLLQERNTRDNTQLFFDAHYDPT